MGIELRLMIRHQHQLIEELRVEKTWVRLTGPRSVARLCRITGNRNILPHLTAHLKVFGGRVKIRNVRNEK